MIRITGGTVYDPANGIDGQVRDICIDNSRIVEQVGGDAKIIDAAGKIVMPGGVDVHTHVAGAALNFARVLIPEDHRRAASIVRDGIRRAGVAGATPTTFATGYLYAGMGWTTVMEAAMPVLTAKHTHEELRDVPIVDKGCYLLMANNETLMDMLENGEQERANDLIGWYMKSAQAYGIKAVNPGGVTAWKQGKNVNYLHEPVPGYKKVTAAEIVTTLARASTDLNLPHPIHLHCNRLGVPGNVSTTLETMKLVEGHRAHMAHLQFHAYGGDDWSTMRSESVKIAEYFNAHPNLTADAGMILFGDTVTITADGPWQYLLYQLTGHKWGNLDVENETGCGIVPYAYKERNLVNAIQWAVGLELMLLIDDPWRISSTTDHPNGAPFWRYPEIMHLLMDADYRRQWIGKLPERALKRTIVAELDREYTLFEIAIINSAGPARTLGLKQKGHLGVGADADIVIYDKTTDIEKMFSAARMVLKSGRIVVEDGQIRDSFEGNKLIVCPQFDAEIEDYIKPLFEQYYTMSFENYPVSEERAAPATVYAV